ncbi:TPM domain-containing protein [Hymenobacter profundi]|uniref:TPM domain-containing protein n=1 Tax=Hymenobacter profundi TaxID=1982110 RepID=A0ABS6WXR7_9BACT|nr:TPM domain-containing protein [Hymenobacter profundi]MBW3128027.1 TPM domain-containing protein [Hymenobacter profundi]
MFRFLVFVFALALGLSHTATAAGELPARPNPFTFVTDKAQLLSETDAKKLESGLRSYADNNGTQVVVVTVPTLDGRTVADYARALGTAWGVGQRNQNNGVVVLIAAQEHQVSIQAGSGLRSQVTPALTDRIISQEMAPQFKQGRYFAGLRAGLNTLLQAANPGSAPTQAPAATSPATTTEAPVASAPLDEPMEQPSSAPFSPGLSSPTPEPSGPGMGTLLLGALVVGGVIWLLVKLFRRKSTAQSTAGNPPDFLPNRNNQPTQGYNQGRQRPTPDFFNRGGNAGNTNNGGGGSGIGGMLATGAAAAAGAYLGNRMASGQSHSGNDLQLGNDNTAAAGMGAAGLGATPPASDADVNDFFGGASAANDPGPDYFSDDVSSGPDYFSSDNSYDDSSSDDTGGGGFDDSSDNSGSW